MREKQERYMRPYHSGNLKHQPYPHWRVKALSWVAKLLGIQFKIDGFPFGASTRTTLCSVCGQYATDCTSSEGLHKDVLRKG